jgi:hypothetical protein
MEKSKLFGLIAFSVISMIWMTILTQFSESIISEVIGIKELKFLLIITAWLPLLIILAYFILSLYSEEKKVAIYKAVAEEDIMGILIFIEKYSINDICIIKIEDKIKEIIETHYFEYIFDNKPNSRPFGLQGIDKIMFRLQQAIDVLEMAHPIKIYPNENKFFYERIYQIFVKYCSDYGSGIFDELIRYFLVHPNNVSSLNKDKHQSGFDLLTSVPWVLKNNEDDDILIETIKQRIDAVSSKLDNNSGDISSLLIKYTGITLKNKLIGVITKRKLLKGQVVVYI